VRWGRTCRTGAVHEPHQSVGDAHIIADKLAELINGGGITCVILAGEEGQQLLIVARILPVA
jgi:hypothetical protein